MCRETNGFKRTIDNAVEIDVGVAEGTTGQGVAADTDGGDRADLVEELEEDTLGHVSEDG